MCSAIVIVEKDVLNKTESIDKIDILDYIKITNFCSSKGNIKRNKMTRQELGEDPCSL